MAEHGEYRSIYTTLADDEEFIATSPLAKAVFYTLKLKLPSTGIGSVAIHVIVALVNEARDRVEAALDELSPQWVQREKSLCWIVNGLRFHPNLSVKDPKHRKSVTTQLNALPRTALTDAFRQHYASWFHAQPEGLPYPSEGPSQGLGSTNTQPTPTPEDRDTTATGSAGEGEADRLTPTAYSFTLIIAANQGMAANPAIGEQFNPLTNSAGKSFQASEAIREAGVGLEFAKSVVFQIAQTFQPDGRSRQINSLGYCANAVIRRWEEHLAACTAGTTEHPSPAPTRPVNGRRGLRVSPGQYTYIPSTEAPTKW